MFGCGDDVIEVWGLTNQICPCIYKQVANATRDSVEKQGEQVKTIAEETERIGTNLEAADVHVRCVFVAIGGWGKGVSWWC